MQLVVVTGVLVPSFFIRYYQRRKTYERCVCLRAWPPQVWCDLRGRPAVFLFYCLKGMRIMTH